MGNSEFIKGLINNRSARKIRRRYKRYISLHPQVASVLNKTNYKLVLIPLVVLAILIFGIHNNAKSQNSAVSQSCAWEICSIDTMKTSRDRARAELNNPSYDIQIEAQIQKIKATGANYVAIDTPYDEEFLPFLTRWVDIARKNELKVWFRGNWSSWEGWFEYPKNMTPDQHISKTYEFITAHANLFRDGDIFDACPECENAQFWPQPQGNGEYNTFIQKQSRSLKKAFSEINKNVRADVASIIGGRALEVVNRETADRLNKTISIDHYFRDPKNILKYIDYFSNKLDAQILLSELGAPIPDIHGEMTEDSQAAYVDQVLNNLYVSGSKVVGVNYWVLTEGTTSLVNLDGSERKAYAVLKKYFTPGIVSGRITNTLGENVEGVKITTADGLNVKSGKDGRYNIYIPPRSTTLSVNDINYTKAKKGITIENPGQKLNYDFVIEPLNPGIIYKIRKFFTGSSKKNPDGAGTWADSVYSTTQGKTRGGKDVPTVRSNAPSALGIAQNNTIAGNFYSLGFGGNIALGFSEGISSEVIVFEVTNPGYPKEKAKVEVSENGSKWIMAGELSQAGIVNKPVSVSCVRYIKITDISNPDDFSDNLADGYDVDGVWASGDPCILPK